MWENARWSAAAGAALAVAFALGGCGTGQIAQTAAQETTTGGAQGRVGQMLVRNAQFTFDCPIAGDAVYHPGDDAPLRLTVVNDGVHSDRLLAVSSPIATSGRITGDAGVPGGHVLSAGDTGPIASITPLRGTAIDITLVGLTSPVRSGLTYPVTFTFERAGDLRIELPVESPRILPPRARE